MSWADAVIEKNIDLPFGMGETKRRDKLTIPIGKLSSLKNAWFDTEGACTKRWGAIKVFDPSGINGAGLSSFRTELEKLAANGTLYGYDPVSGAMNAAGGIVSSYRAQRQPIRRNYPIPMPGPMGVAVNSGNTGYTTGQSSPTNFDMLYMANQTGSSGTGDYIVWCEAQNVTGDLTLGAMSVANGTPVPSATIGPVVSSGVNPLLVNLNGTAIVFYALPGTGTKYRVFNAATLAWGAAQTLQATAQDATTFDIAVISATQVALVYCSAVNTVTAVVCTFAAGSFTTGLNHAFTMKTVNLSCTYLPTNGYLAITGVQVSTTASLAFDYAVWGFGGGVIVAVTTKTLTTPAGSPGYGLVRAVPVEAFSGGATAWEIWAEITAVPFVGTFINTALWPNQIIRCTLDFTTAFAQATLQAGGGLASRPFKNTTIGQLCALMASQSQVQSTTYLISADGLVRAMMAPGSGGGYTPQQYGGGSPDSGSHVPQVSLNGTTLWAPMLTQTNVTAIDGFLVSNLVLDAAQLSVAAPMVADAGDGLYIGGSFIGRYDGAYTQEHNWFQFPEGVTISAPAFQMTSNLSPDPNGGNFTNWTITPPNGRGVTGPMQWNLPYGIGCQNDAVTVGSNGQNISTLVGAALHISAPAGFAQALLQANNMGLSTCTAAVLTSTGIALIQFTGVGAGTITGVTLPIASPGNGGTVATGNPVMCFTYCDALIAIGQAGVVASSTAITTGANFPTNAAVLLNPNYADTQPQIASKIAQAFSGLGVTLSPIGTQVALSINASDTFASLTAFALPQPASSQQFQITALAKGSAGIPHSLFMNFPGGNQIANGQWFAFDNSPLGGGLKARTVVYFRVGGAAAVLPVLSVPANTYNTVQVAISGTELPYQVAALVGAAITTALSSTSGGYGWMQTGGSASAGVINGGPYDGTLAVWNVNVTPATTTIGTFNNSVCGLQSQGVYRYAVTYRATDQQGNVDESGYVAQAVTVSGPAGLTSGGSGCVLTIPPPRITNRTGVTTITAEVYRSIANDATDLWRLTSAQAPLTFPAGGGPIVYVDGLDDVTLQGNSQIYTTGNVALNTAPPAASIVKQGQGRVVLAGIEGAPTSWWYSSPGNENGVKNFSAFFQSTLPDNSDPIASVEFMDDYIVFLCGSSIYVTSGPGPDSTGGGTQFSTPQRLPGNIGCSGASCSYKDGIAFVSTHGIWRLGRDLQLEPIGADILPVIAGQNLGSGAVAPTMTFSGAIADPQYRAVLFYGPQGTLAYSYEGEMAGQWSEFPTMVATSMVPWIGPDMSTATMTVSGRPWLTYLNSSTGNIWQECSGFSSSPIYADESGPFAVTLKTGRLNLAGPNGLSVVWETYVSGVFSTAAGQVVNVSFFYDQDDSYSDTIAMTPVQSAAYPNGQAGSPPSDLRFDMRRTEMTNLTIQVTENVSGYAPRGLPLQLNGMSLHGGILPGPRRQGPGSNTYAG